MGEMIVILGEFRSGKARMAERLAGLVDPVSDVASATYDRTDPEIADLQGWANRAIAARSAIVHISARRASRSA